MAHKGSIMAGMTLRAARRASQGKEARNPLETEWVRRFAEDARGAADELARMEEEHSRNAMEVRKSLARWTNGKSVMGQKRKAEVEEEEEDESGEDMLEKLFAKHGTSGPCGK